MVTHVALVRRTSILDLQSAQRPMDLCWSSNLPAEGCCVAGCLHMAAGQWIGKDHLGTVSFSGVDHSGGEEELYPAAFSNLIMPVICNGASMSAHGVVLIRLDPCIYLVGFIGLLT